MTFTSIRESFWGSDFLLFVDYGCATVRELHTIHPILYKYMRIFQTSTKVRLEKENLSNVSTAL